MKILDSQGRCLECKKDLSKEITFMGRDRAEKIHKEAHHKELLRNFFNAGKELVESMETSLGIARSDGVFHRFSEAVTAVETFEEKYC